MSRRKLTYEFVKSQIESYGYFLLSNNYVGIDSYIDIMCPLGHKYSVTYHHFSRGRRCAECVGVKRKTIDFIKEQFKKEGYIVLSKKYKNNKQKLNVLCPEKHKWVVCYADFQQGSRCLLCYHNRRKGKNNNMWKGGVTKLNIPPYDTFAPQLSWCEEVRRDPENLDYLQVKCTESSCRKWFTPTRTQANTRIAAVKVTDGSNFYCSEGCKKSCSIYDRSKFPKGFINNDKVRQEQADWAAMVKERDNYECQKCGATENLVAHHMEGLNANPLMSADVDIGITLCKECHKKVHKELGCRFTDMKC